MNTRDLFELIEKYLQNPSAFENQLEEEIKKRFPLKDINLLILEFLEFSQRPDLPREKRIKLLEWLGKFLLENLELEKAIKIYKLLSKETSKDEYTQILEKLIFYKDLEKFKGLREKISINFKVATQLAEEAAEEGKSIESFILEKYRIPKVEILKSIEEFYKIPALDLKRLLAQRQVKKLPEVINIKSSFFKDLLSIPYVYQDKVYIFTYHPKDPERVERIKRLLNLEEVEIAFAFKEDILSAIEAYYQEGMLELLIEEEEVPTEKEEAEALELDSTVVQLVNQIIEEAYRRRASDIHWESLTGRRGLLVRFRVDGECFHYMTIPESQKRSCISRIKIMAGLDIAEKRLPQDGKIKFRTKDGQTFEIRVATIPTIENNEDVVMRILGGIEFRSLEEIDLLPDHYAMLKSILDLPYGLILCVGPTGSGKTTTLHACLKYLNKPNKKIWTAEDPVEIVQDGLRQVQVNPKIGLTFSRVLRAFLRADPDVIMIGETRDQETAHTLIEAALTGHLVLSTLHTNSAPETITRLLGMGIDPFNFADSLLGIIAQRLAKRLCKYCKRPYTPKPEEIERIKFEYGEHPVKPLTESFIKEAVFYEPAGCEECNFTGFKGRIGLHEILVPDEELKNLIIKNAPANEIRKVAMQKGMITLKQDGILKILRGETTLKQVLAVTLR
jgi:type II secretory ATPase GspE/PulE/Tfp pilus assembly ATPase PilB-like protein